MTTTVDLNSDLGEGFGRWELGDDDALLGVVTSANVACGFHAGDPSIMRRTCEIAARRGVAIGAHPSYRDRAGFGRRFVDVEPAVLTDEVIYQIAALEGFARLAGTRVGYVKPHGALYNTIGQHEEQAAAVVSAIHSYDPTLPVLGLRGSVWMWLAEDMGQPVAYEAFADRAYTADGRLVSRREPGAVLHDAKEIAERCVALATTGRIAAVDGTDIQLTADSICVHGDTAGAVGIARGVRDALSGAGVALEPFSAARAAPAGSA